MVINSSFYTSSGIIPPEHLTFVSLLSAKGLYSQGIEWNTPGRRRGEGRAKGKIIALWTPCLIPKKWKWSIKKRWRCSKKIMGKGYGYLSNRSGSALFSKWGVGVGGCNVSQYSAQIIQDGGLTFELISYCDINSHIHNIPV